MPRTGPEERYRYFILGNVTPVRLVYSSQDLAVGAQIPDALEPGGFRWSHEHWERIEMSEGARPSGAARPDY